jgi:hypothetical protein
VLLKKDNLRRSLIIFCLFLIPGILTATVATRTIAPIFLMGRSFDARGESIKNLFHVFFAFSFSVVYFLAYSLLSRVPQIRIIFQKGSRFISIKTPPLLLHLDKSQWIYPTITIFLFLIGLSILYILGKIILFPYALELREGAIQLSTQALLNGINPYSLSNNPIYINVYGILYNLIVLPFAALFGNTLPLHRFISGIFIVGQLLIIAKVMRMRKTSWQAILLALLFMSIGQLFLTSPLARPDTFGNLLFLLTLFIPLLNKFSSPSLLVSAMLGVLSYQTKAYFLIGILIVAAYLFLFISKKRAILYTLLAGILFVISIFFIHSFLETFFSNTLYLYTDVTSKNYSFMVKQSLKFAKDYWGFLMIALGVLYSLINKKISGNDQKVYADIRNFDAPFINIHFDFLLFCFLVSSAAVVIVLGEHSGTYMTYYFQLITPFLVMYTIIWLDHLKNYRNLIFSVLLLTLFTQGIDNLKVDFLPFGKNDWLKLESYVLKSDRILNSPLDVSILIEQKKEVAISGYTQYFFMYSKAPFFLYPDSEKINQEGLKYLNEISRNITDKKYDFLETIQNDNYEPLLLGERLNISQSNGDFIRKYYHLVETLTLPMPHTYEEWKIGIWKPN